MSRFALLLLSSALMLVIAACDTNGDDAADDLTDDTTTIPADDEVNGVNGDDDVVVPDTEDDFETEPADDAFGVEDDDAVATDPPADDEFAQEDDAAVGDEEMALDDEDVVDPAEEEMVDPGEGMFFDLTFEEANEMTAFELREPETVPEALEFQTIIGMASMGAVGEEAEEGEEGEESADEAATIVFTYEQAADEEMMQGLPVEFTQSTEIDMSEGLGPDIDAEQITIGDREVTRINVMQETGDEVVAYAWDEDEVHFSLAAIIGGDLQESDLEEMIASIPTS